MHFLFRGWKAVLSTLPALQNPGNRSFTAFQARIKRYDFKKVFLHSTISIVYSHKLHVLRCLIMWCIHMINLFDFHRACIHALPTRNRWCRLRCTINPFISRLEPFVECFGLGLLGALSSHYLLGISILLFLSLHILFWFACDLALLRSIEVRKSVASSPGQHF